MKYTLYSMGEKCPFCVKAEELFAEEIESGFFLLKDAEKAGGRSQGFPYFEGENGEKFTGLPSSKEQLFKELGVESENYVHSEAGSNTGHIMLVVGLIILLIGIVTGGIYFYLENKKKSVKTNFSNNYLNNAYNFTR